MTSPIVRKPKWWLFAFTMAAVAAATAAVKLGTGDIISGSGSTCLCVFWWRDGLASRGAVPVRSVWQAALVLVAITLILVGG